MIVVIETDNIIPQMKEIRVLVLQSYKLEPSQLKDIHLPNLESLSIAKCEYENSYIFKNKYENLKGLKVLGIKGIVKYIFY